jgi:hypothetical protein
MLGFVLIGFPVALGTFASTFRATHVGPYLIYSLLLGINFLKLAGGVGLDPAILPHFHVVSVFIGLVIGDNLIRQLRSVASVTNFVSWASVNLSGLKTEEELSFLLQKGLDTIGGNLAELLISDGSQSRIISVRKGFSSEPLVDVKSCSNLPPIFAAIVTSQEFIGLLDGNSDRAMNMRKTSVFDPSIGFLSAAPINISSSGFGAIVVSGVDSITDPQELTFHIKIFELL